METDPFSDSIRRKLESIRPDFKEKDWARMQSTLLQHTTPPPTGSPAGFQPVAGSVWSAQPWLLAAAVSTAVLVGVVIWQQAQIKNLRQTVGQLSGQKLTTQPRQTPAETTKPGTTTSRTEGQSAQRIESMTSPLSPSAASNAAPASRLDTVYVTRYVPVPASSARSRTTEPLANSPEIQPGDRSAPERVQSLATVQPQQRRTNQLAPEQRNDVADVTSPVSTGSTNTQTDAVSNETSNRAEPSSRPTRSLDSKTDMLAKGLTAGNRSKRNRRSSTAATNDVAVRASNGSTSGSSAPATSVNEAASSQTGSTEVTGLPALSYKLTASRPLTIEATDWSKALTNRARPLRPARTAIIGGQVVPESQPISPIVLGFRVGAGAEVTRSVLSGGVLGELLVGNRLSLGVGLNMASFAGGTFFTDEDFDRKKRMNFRHDYARGIDPRSEILNIGIHTERLLIPITMGYRIPVSQTLSLLPSVGTTLNLQTHEFVTFTYRQPFRTFEAASYRIFRPVELINTLNFGAGVEWKRNHWVWQAGPVITIATNADLNWQAGTAIGLRARLFYQF
ncbi:MAG: hypothetical protein JWP57_1991 [Spirosoma sp.]|nr:hypothetical protein [Spirosoma sp.]